MIEHFLTKNDCYKRNVKIIKPKGIMLHSTGANNTKVSRYVDIGSSYSSNHWNKSGLQVCVHGFIGMLDDKVQTVQTLPFNIRGWHCGKGSKGSANDTHISFECCEDDLKNATYFMQIVVEAAKTFAQICYQYGFDPMQDGVIISHAEGHKRGIASNHGDIDHWFKRFNFTMDEFRNRVRMELNHLKEEKEMESVSEWAREAWDWAVDNEIIADNLPQFNVTKEQMCLMLYKTYNLIKKE